MYRPSITKPFAQDVPSLIVEDFRDNLDMWGDMRQQWFQICEILEEFKTTDVYTYRSARGADPTLWSGSDSIVR